LTAAFAGVVCRKTDSARRGPPPFEGLAEGRELVGGEHCLNEKTTWASFLKYRQPEGTPSFYTEEKPAFGRPALQERTK